MSNNPTSSVVLQHPAEDLSAIRFPDEGPEDLSAADSLDDLDNVVSTMSKIMMVDDESCTASK